MVTHQLGAAMIALVLTSSCASSAPPARSAARRVESVRQVAVVTTGDSKFTVVEHRDQPGRTLDEVVKWTSYPWLRPLAALVHSGINWFLDSGRAAAAAPEVTSPRDIVADAMARRLRASGVFDEVRTLDREPVGPARQITDAVVRVAVPRWGLVRVRQGNPDLVSAFADVQAQMAMRGTGVIVWESSEDVTDPERVPLDSFMRDRAFTRQQCLDVLERAGQRLASELLYAWGSAR
jgi:hypothetical protein